MASNERHREARHYVVLPDGKVQCRLCPHQCRLGPGRAGICRVRENVDGRLVTRIYGECSSISLDPVEKKPLYHFHPGSTILSLGTIGCNLSCRFCQNWQISQDDAPTRYLGPQQVVDMACRYRDEGCIGLAYTYSEPLIWFEYVLDTAKLAADRGLKNVVVTNGMIMEEPLRELLPYIDAMNIDIKAFSEEFYRKYCGGKLQPVLETARIVASSCHLEVTNLLIPGLNDAADDLHGLCGWIRDNLGYETPLHLSRYHPAYKMQLPPTPVDTMRKAGQIARSYLKYVHLGNMPLHFYAES